MIVYAIRFRKIDGWQVCKTRYSMINQSGDVCTLKPITAYNRNPNIIAKNKEDIFINKIDAESECNIRNLEKSTQFK